MTTIEEIKGKVAFLSGAVHKVNLALDVIREKINALQVGNVVSQDQLNALNQSLEAAVSEAGQVVLEADEVAAPVVAEPVVEEVPAPVVEPVSDSVVGNPNE